jgi:hypothetical protein|tara:strand:+ start:1014 stop:1334 length:321 start_codon:yes stop_codon:yes gene_type:complete
MASTASRKGTYHENFFVKLFQSWKIKAKRQPLSGALGGEYKGDLVLELNGEKIIAEIKYRKSSSFPSPFTTMVNRDAVIYKRGGNDEPRWVMFLSEETVKRLWRTK